MPTALKLKQDLEAQIKKAKTYTLDDEDKAAKEAFEDKRTYLQTKRKNSGIEEIWAAADKAYIPHTISGSDAKKKVMVSDDELGWRSQMINLDDENKWQEDSVPPNPYIKIQTALGLIVDRNPVAILSPGNKNSEPKTLLMKKLYERSWEFASSKKAALKPFIFNCAKYGKGIGRTFPLELTRKVRDLKKFVPNNTKQNVYEEVDQTYYDDVFRESLSPWQVWEDDSCVLGNPLSMTGVIYYKDYSWLKLSEQFGHLENFKYIKPSEKSLDNIAGADKKNENLTKVQERIWFWEDLERDCFFVMTDDGVVLINEPMPQTPKNKRLSIWIAPWTMRDDKSLNGIGVYEAMRNDHKLYMKVRNMTMDQLVVSIYREFFYSGTDTLSADGVMKMAPGKGRQVTDPKNMKWNEVPPPTIQAWDAQDRILQRIDDVTGISKSLQGEITGSTAFEISQARESALKRMKTPLDHITDALETDGYITLGIIEDMYSVPKIKLLADEKYIQPFELDTYKREDGERLQEGEDYEAEYRELPLKLKKNEDGSMMESEKETFFTLSPEDFPWQGSIKIKGQSIIADSELLERTTTVEMANIVFPMFVQPREIAEKPAREIIKAYGKEPEDWIPDAWLVEQPMMPNGLPEQSIFSDINAQPEGQAPPSPSASPTNPPFKNLMNSLTK